MTADILSIPVIKSKHVEPDFAMLIPRGVSWPLCPGETLEAWARRVLADPRVCLLTGVKDAR